VALRAAAYQGERSIADATEERNTIAGLVVKCSKTNAAVVHPRRLIVEFVTIAQSVCTSALVPEVDTRLLRTRAEAAPMAQALCAHILIVEDNADTRDVVQRVLQMSGYDAVAVADGLDALAYLRGGGRASAIVTDVSMPRMDGYALRRALSADPRFASIPVIAYTADWDRPMPNFAGVYRKGTDDPQRLLEMLADACSEPASH
jgi:CheY-like chemotaxis protein